MNEEMKNKLNEFLGKLIENMEKAGEFAVDQIPDVVQQALTWFALKSGLLFALGIAFLFVAYRFFSWGKSNWYVRDSDGDIIKDRWGGDAENEAVQIISCVGGAVMGFFGALFILLNLEWLQILVAPKWFIVSEMSKLIG